MRPPSLRFTNTTEIRHIINVRHIIGRIDSPAYSLQLRSRDDREFERKSRTFARPIAVSRKGACHFFGRQRATVQTEPVTVLAGGKAMGKEPRQVFRRNSFAIILDKDS